MQVLDDSTGNRSISHSLRELNRVSDLLAKEGAKKRLFNNTRILEVPPVFVNDALWTDILGTTFVRKTLVCNLILFQTIMSNWTAPLWHNPCNYFSQLIKYLVN